MRPRHIGVFILVLGQGAYCTVYGRYIRSVKHVSEGACQK
jgi:hypothetical protein